VNSARTWNLQAAGGVGAVSAYVALVLFWVLRQPGGPDATRFVVLSHLAPALLAALLAFQLASRRCGRSLPARTGWATLGSGALAFALSQAAAARDQWSASAPVHFPALSEQFYLFAYPCLFLGLLGVALDAGGRSRAIWDSLIALGAPFALSWYFLLKPLYSGVPLGLALVVRLALPLLDVGILFWALVLIHTPAQPPRALGLRLLGAAAAFLATTDTVYAYLTLYHDFSIAGVLDAGWAGGFACLCLGACYLRADALREGREALLGAVDETTDLGGFSSALCVLTPVLATIGSVSAMIWADTRGPSPTVSLDVIAVSFALVVAVMGRQVFTLVENAQVHSNLHVFNRRLEEKVDERTHQLKALHEIARTANSSLRPAEVLEQVLHRVVSGLRAEAGAVWLMEDYADPEGEVHLLAQVGFDLSQHGRLLASVPARWRNGLARVLMTRQSLPLPVLAADGTRNADGSTPDCLCAVLQWQGTPIGVLGAVRWQERFGETERRLLEAVAIELSAALQNAHLYDMAVRAADRDGVTRLLNHRAVVRRLDEECKRSGRTGEPMAVLLLDLNNFKLFNDTHGHLVGDQVLKTTASLLTELCRATDVIGRYGGDEFIIICPTTDAGGARDLATRIQEQMAATSVQGTGGERLPLSGSIGFAVYPEGAASQHELLVRADMNMYDAKAQGGDAIVGGEDADDDQNHDYSGGFSALDALVTAVDRRDHYTRRHSEDVTEYSLMIAQQLGLSQDTMRTLRLAGLLHDLGKIAIPDAILRKPSALTDEEYDLMKQHPVYGWLIVSAIPALSETLPAIRHHHERYDGRGYPDALAGEDIPLLGRLMAVADAYSAMTTDRPYRKGMPPSQAVDQLRKGVGTQFDPAMVEAFLIALVNRARAAA
jgi:diguanylate cyclase (GGDEF)-like protein